VFSYPTVPLKAYKIFVRLSLQMRTETWLLPKLKFLLTFYFVRHLFLSSFIIGKARNIGKWRHLAEFFSAKFHSARSRIHSNAPIVYSGYRFSRHEISLILFNILYKFLYNMFAKFRNYVPKCHKMLYPLNLNK
jgi:hypothetical protein